MDGADQKRALPELRSTGGRSNGEFSETTERGEPREFVAGLARSDFALFEHFARATGGHAYREEAPVDSEKFSAPERGNILEDYGRRLCRMYLVAGLARSDSRSSSTSPTRTAARSFGDRPRWTARSTVRRR